MRYLVYNPHFYARIRREAYLTNEIIIRTELLKARYVLRVKESETFAPAIDDDACRGQLAHVHRELSSESPPPQGDGGGGGDLSLQVEEGGLGSGYDDEEEGRSLRKRLVRAETGDVTDGNIIV